MKIKSVCEMTGLSDRTIRYYIEEKLISPSYTENYLGRKNFSFSQGNIDELNNIAILRKFDFSIEEIRDIIADTQKSKTIIQNVKDRTENSAVSIQERKSALSRIDSSRIYTVAELAEELSKPYSALPVQNEQIERNILKTVFDLIKTALVFAIVWLPFAVSIFTLIMNINDGICHYPVYNYKMILIMLVSFLPSLAVLIISKTKLHCKKIAKKILLILCVLSVPVTFISTLTIISESETKDIRNYRDFDADCTVNRDDFFQVLFPDRAHYFENVKQQNGNYETVYLDAKYYYRYREIHSAYDVYAEWPLPEDEFIKEVERVTALFKERRNSIELKKGSFECLVWFDGDRVFHKATDDYTYYIFAYDEERNIVRYLCCESCENTLDPTDHILQQPYYLQLDW